MHLEWFGWSLLLLIIWGIVRETLKSSEIKKEMLVVSAWTSLLGLTEPLFVPKYWNPPSLFDLARNTGFDIESFIFCFAIGGLGYALDMAFFPVGHEPQMPRDERIDARHKFHLPLLLTTPAIFILLFAGTDLNPIYNAVIAMMAGGILTWYCRPDLKRKMVVSAVLFLCLYFLYFMTLIAAVPGYVQRVWNLGAISGIMILGVPLEETDVCVRFRVLLVHPVRTFHVEGGSCPLHPGVLKRGTLRAAPGIRIVMPPGSWCRIRDAMAAFAEVPKIFIPARCIHACDNLWS